MTLANAVGTGVADDKASMPTCRASSEYYLNEDAILPNVETHICGEPEGLAYTLGQSHELVVKPVGESGGYGITIGPRASRGGAGGRARRLLADPSNWISQPMIGLSVAPTLTRGRPAAAAPGPAAVRHHRPRHLGAAGRPVPGRD